MQGLAYKDANDARRRVGAFDTVYNTQRLHSALDYLTPEEYEQRHSPDDRLKRPHKLTWGLSPIFRVSI
ncbi:integrase core domain-containing protein [Mesorhizobium sp.]|uniref:integrase core domain-containing protein n=1 Tax=Mesorhizobium sp. TaxID=1871066 RepID=UPI000FE94289|nr:MAG: hypothetical protein EOS43_31110 [Mesorhizobium sp.]